VRTSVSYGTSASGVVPDHAGGNAAYSDGSLTNTGSQPACPAPPSTTTTSTSTTTTAPPTTTTAPPEYLGVVSLDEDMTALLQVALVFVVFSLGLLTFLALVER